MDYTIRFATEDDTESIMRFIDVYWRKGHILARDRKLFGWQYGGADHRLNIVIGLDEAANIQGMLGFVPYDRTDDRDMALALWKANPATGFLGIRLLKYLMDRMPHRAIVCPGINPKTTAKIYEYVGMQVGIMDHWYRLADTQAYLIAKITDPGIPKYRNAEREAVWLRITSEARLAEVFDKMHRAVSGTVPYKSKEYLIKRYERHPAYRYQLYGWSDEEGAIKTIFVFRVQECNGSRALRLIDCIGETEHIADITGQIDSLLSELSCEYADVYAAGIKEEIFLAGGWRKAEPDGNIIPDYFAPFELRPVEIYYATSCPEAVLFKGDGDQDRPS